MLEGQFDQKLCIKEENKNNIDINFWWRICLHTTNYRRLNHTHFLRNVQKLMPSFSTSNCHLTVPFNQSGVIEFSLEKE